MYNLKMNLQLTYINKSIYVISINLDNATLLRSIQQNVSGKTYLFFIKFKVKTSNLEVFRLIKWGFVAVHLVPEK